MFTFIIISILIFSVTSIFFAYYNYVVHFHRIQLFGRKLPKAQTYAGFIPAFNLNDIFVREEDISMLQLLMMRKLPVVVCLGDSITHGSVSTNYVTLLQEKYNGKFLFVNSGINGNLVYNLKNRLKSDCTDLDPDYITILIGTNDVNSRKDAKHLNNYIKLQKLPSIPDRAFFRDNLKEIIEILKQTTKAKIAILSLPVIGEVLDSELNSFAVEYSADIKALAGEYNIAYLPLNETQRDFLFAIKNRKPTYYKKMNLLLYFLLMIGRSFDKIAEINGCYLTYDGLHETTRGATMIEDLIASWIESEKELPPINTAAAPQMNTD